MAYPVILEPLLFYVLHRVVARIQALPERMRAASDADLLRTVVESCPTKLLLANPSLDRRHCAELFQLNDMELDLGVCRTANVAVSPVFRSSVVATVLMRDFDSAEARWRVLVSAPNHAERAIGLQHDGFNVLDRGRPMGTHCGANPFFRHARSPECGLEVLATKQEQ